VSAGGDTRQTHTEDGLTDHRPGLLTSQRHITQNRLRNVLDYKRLTEGHAMGFRLLQGQSVKRAPVSGNAYWVKRYDLPLTLKLKTVQERGVCVCVYMLVHTERKSNYKKILIFRVSRKFFVLFL
jgi:hypothetical protein